VPPETATPELDEELTVPEEGCNALVDEVLEDDELEVVELDELEVVVAAVPVDDEAAVPGMVSALTVPKMPTPATAAKATPAVRRLSRDRALSRARILASEGFVCSMLVRMLPPSQSSL
jgi:Trk K+ transport system NAD-binding subunit